MHRRTTSCTISQKVLITDIRAHLATSTDDLPVDTIIQVAKTSMSSKIIGAQSEFFAKLAVDAVKSVGFESASKGVCFFFYRL